MAVEPFERITGASWDDEPREVFPLSAVHGLELRPTAWLVRNLLEADALALVFGDPGCGKSFLAIEVASCVAGGEPFHGLDVESGPVVYLAGEGQNNIAKRFHAWSIARQAEIPAELYISQRPAALSDRANALAVREAVDRIASEHGAPALIVVDTLARNFGAADENSTQDMGALIQALDQLRNGYGATVLLVHHTGHADKTRARGAMALKGALDAEYRMEKDEDGLIRLQATKMKDAPPPEPLAFRLSAVELPVENDAGEHETSAVLDATQWVEQAKAKGPTRKDYQALRVLVRMQQTGAPKFGEWQAECASEGILTGRTTEAVKKDMGRIRNRLRNADLIRQGMGRGVWVVTEQGVKEVEDEE